MLRKTVILLIPMALMCSASSYGDEPRPSNYDECIIDSMKGVSSDIAARAIIESCGNLFPKQQSEPVPKAAPAPAPPAPVAPAPAPPAPVPAAAPPAAQAAPAIAPVTPLTTDARSLTKEELARLGFKAKVFGSAYRVTVENRNPNLTLTEVTIAVWDDDDPAADRNEYSKTVTIAPQESAEIKYTVHYRGTETGWKWDVVAARGVE